MFWSSFTPDGSEFMVRGAGRVNLGINHRQVLKVNLLGKEVRDRGPFG
jgi:hypothetical protein